MEYNKKRNLRIFPNFWFSRDDKFCYLIFKCKAVGTIKTKYWKEKTDKTEHQKITCKHDHIYKIKSRKIMRIIRTNNKESALKEVKNRNGRLDGVVVEGFRKKGSDWSTVGIAKAKPTEM